MRRFQLPFVILGILCAVIFFGCGDDDDDDNNNDDDNNDNNDNGGSSNADDIVGTWKLVSTDGEALPPGNAITMTINSDGTWSQTFESLVPGIGQFTAITEGTYQASGNKITGKTTDVKVEPDLGFPVPTEGGISEAETTYERDGNQLIFTDTDENGEASVTVFEKQ